MGKVSFTFRTLQHLHCRPNVKNSIVVTHSYHEIVLKTSISRLGEDLMFSPSDV